MELVTIIIAGVSIILSVSIIVAVRKYLEVKRKNAEIESLRRSLNAYAETYTFEEADLELANKCKAYINTKFNGQIEREFAKYKTLEEKKVFARQVASELAECMEVNIDNIQIENLGLATRGATCPDNGSITVYLNEVVLVADPVQFVKTLCHEYKHCAQYQSFTDNVWGYSPGRVAQWLYSWDNYVACESIANYEAYVKQIVEIDANKFADTVFST